MGNIRYFIRTRTSITKDQKVWTQGHCQYIGICYPVHTTEIPILTSWCNTSLWTAISYIDSWSAKQTVGQQNTRSQNRDLCSVHGITNPYIDNVLVSIPFDL